MSVGVAEWLVRLASIYSAAGIAFGLLFAMWGAGRADPVARDGTWGFRLLLIPGAAALWPLLLYRMLVAPGRRWEERNRHLDAARSSMRSSREPTR
ncbi:MAG: hypothetical protein ABJD11_01485 [Gemmatimonadota bacterium]